MQHMVFRTLAAVETPHGRSRESTRPVLGENGKPLTFEDQRAAIAAAERMTRENARIGSDHCTNVRFNAGWTGEWK